MTRRRTQAGGFVLLMALLVVAVVAVLMAGAARRSLGRAVAAGDAAEQLQLRWGRISAAATLLPLAPDWIEKRQRPRRAPVTETPIRVTLGGLEFDMTLADENAKIEVNALYDRLGRRRTQQTLAAALRQTDVKRVDVKLTPFRPQRPRKEIEASAMPLFGSLGQAVDADSAQQAKAAASLITCWSGGKLNIRRASPAALAAVCTGLISPQAVRQVLGMRAESPNLELGSVVNAFAKTDRDTQRIKHALTDRSTHYSIWITARSRQRAWCRLTVAKVTEPAGRGIGVGGDEDDRRRRARRVKPLATFDW